MTFDLQPLLKLREEALEEKLACAVIPFSSESRDGPGQGESMVGGGLWSRS